MNKQNTIYAVLGATASGKTDKAIELALEVDGEIVNCDSRQIYSEMIIGTASPSEEEKAQVKHHLFNFLSPTKKFSAADYQNVAVPCIKEILNRNKTPILTGGTGFYYSAIADGLGVAGHDAQKATELIEQVLGDAHEEAVKENISDEEYFMKVYTENDWQKHLNH